MAVRPSGIVSPCCRYLLDKPDTLDKDPRHSDHWKEIRRKMLDGKPVDGCSLCYKEEISQVKSMRQQSLMREPLYQTEEVGDLRYLEIAFSNLCNLACVSCSSQCSSKWKAEDIKYGRANNSGALIDHGFDIAGLDLRSVENLKIMGGEPFLDQTRFINLMQKLSLKKVNLNVYTNGTVLPNEQLISLIESCKKIRFAVSLDGIGKVNDWYRWPSNFETIEKHLSIYDQKWKDNDRFILLIHSVINAYNVWYVKEFSDYVQNKFPNWRIEWDWIQWPHWQRLSVLPESSKKDLIDKFTEYAIMYDIANKPYKVAIDRLSEPSIESWETFKSMTQRLEKERNLDVLEMIPALREVWKCP